MLRKRLIISGASGMVDRIAERGLYDCFFGFAAGFTGWRGLMARRVPC